MRLLHNIPKSVLWLIEDNCFATRNIRNAAAERGIDSRRLVFCEKTKMEDHLSRHQLADIFLDTIPVNAHTTASDALWAGLPLVTCRGDSFASRVAASLLSAIGLPELVADSLERYEAITLNLAIDTAALRCIREKLSKNRLGTPLFDINRFRDDIEIAYRTMWQITQRGEAPRSFSVMA